MKDEGRIRVSLYVSKPTYWFTSIFCLPLAASAVDTAADAETAIAGGAFVILALILGRTRKILSVEDDGNTTTVSVAVRVLGICVHKQHLRDVRVHFEQAVYEESEGPSRWLRATGTSDSIDLLRSNPLWHPTPNVVFQADLGLALNRWLAGKRKSTGQV